MSPKHSKKYEAWIWLKELHAAGYDIFYHKDLPKDLQNVQLHRSATHAGYLVPTGNIDTYHVKEYYIRQSILNLSNPAHYRGRGAV